jgi:hypothetical protein
MVTYSADPFGRGRLTRRAARAPARQPHNVNSCGLLRRQPAGDLEHLHSKDARVVSGGAIGANRIYELNWRLECLREYFDQFWTQALEAFKEAAEKKS